MSSTPDIFISFAAGVLSFLSPCILPLIPSYISYIGGVSLKDLHAERPPRFLILGKTLLFILGFSIVFVALGVLFSGTGFFLSGVSRTINIIAGIIVILLGLNIIFDFWKLLNIEKKFHLNRQPKGLIGSVLIGMAFGAGWSPCIGPILAAILFLAGNSAQIGTGMLYLSIYSLGLGLPFILTALFFIPLTERLNKLKKHMKSIRIISGIFLVIIGLLIMFGRLQSISAAFVQLGRNISQWESAHPASARIVIGSVYLFIAFLFFVPAILRKVKTASASQHKPGSDDRPKDPAEPVPAQNGGNVFTPGKTIFAGLFTILAILQYAGLINTAAFLFNWFTYQGL
jgi:cytochrome c-type biogenesis protein